MNLTDKSLFHEFTSFKRNVGTDHLYIRAMASLA